MSDATEPKATETTQPESQPASDMSKPDLETHFVVLEDKRRNREDLLQGALGAALSVPLSLALEIPQLFAPDKMEALRQNAITTISAGLITGLFAILARDYDPADIHMPRLIKQVTFGLALGFLAVGCVHGFDAMNREMKQQREHPAPASSAVSASATTDEAPKRQPATPSPAPLPVATQG